MKRLHGENRVESFGIWEAESFARDSLKFENVVSFSSAVTLNLFPLSRCASAIQIVRPLESRAETQPQLQPALLRLSAMTFPELHVDRIVPLLVSTQQSQNDMKGGAMTRASVLN